MARFVKRGKKYALMGNRQRVIVPFLFDRVEPFCAGYGVGSLDGYGDFLFDESGKLVFRQAFDRIVREGVSNGEEGPCKQHAHYIVTHKGRCCLLDLRLNMLVPWGEYKIDWGPSEGIWVVRNPRCQQYGYAGMGRVIMPCKFSNARSFQNGYAAVKWRGGKWGLIDALGHLVIPDIYDSMCDVSEGVVGAYRDGRAGFLELAGRVIIPFDYKIVQEFRDGVASVETLDGRWRTIDHSGAFVDEMEKCVVPEGLRAKFLPPRKAAPIAAARKKLRKWFDGLKGHVFATRKKTKVGYLIHFAAPYTDSGTGSEGKGVQFKVEQKMRDDAWYCSTTTGEDERRVFEKEKALSGRRNPLLARRCSGISFYLTESQLSGKDFEEVCRKPRGKGKESVG